MNSKHLWWELIALVLVLFIAWGLIKLTPIPAIFWPGPPTPAPVPTATPPVGTFYFTLPASDLSQVDSLLGGAPPADARLIVLANETESTANGTAILHRTSQAFCVRSVAFLDADNLGMEQYNKDKTKSVLFALKRDDLERYGKAMLDKAQLYLVPDPACSATPG